MKLLVLGLQAFILTSSQANSVCYILPEYSDGDYRNISLLGVAAVKNDPDSIEYLISGGCDINYNETAMHYGEDVYVVGSTTLHIASIEGSEEVVVKLLTIPGINQSINAQDEYGATPAYAASSWGYYEVVSLLAEAGADIELADDDGATPVHAAASYGYIDTVKTLAELGANLDVLGGDGDYSPLMAAAYYGYREVVQYLVDQGADVNIRDGDKKTALYWAKWVNYRRIVKILEDNGAKL